MDVTINERSASERECFAAWGERWRWHTACPCCVDLQFVAPSLLRIFSIHFLTMVLFLFHCHERTTGPRKKRSDEERKKSFFRWFFRCDDSTTTANTNALTQTFNRMNSTVSNEIRAMSMTMTMTIPCQQQHHQRERWRRRRRQWIKTQSLGNIVPKR